MSRCVQFLNICTYITVGFLVVWMPIPISSSNSTSKCSLMIGQCEKYGYNFFSPLSFWENANLVFWPCQNSWFWGWKIFFSIAIFHKNHFAYYVLELFCTRKHWNRAFVSFWLFVPRWHKTCGKKWQIPYLKAFWLKNGLDS